MSENGNEDEAGFNKTGLVDIKLISEHELFSNMHVIMGIKIRFSDLLIFHACVKGKVIFIICDQFCSIEVIRVNI